MDNNNNGWISVEERLPEVKVNCVEYFKVKFSDETEDEKPFRNSPTRNIFGFMTEKKVTHWQPIP